MVDVEPAMYAPGQQLPGTVYRVVRHLATGGMGSVFDVEDVTVGKRYVLKTLHPQLIAREDLARRMEAEARTLAKLQHPNIVDVVTAGVTQDPRRVPFYVMERLNGQNLRVVLEKKGALELPHAYRISIDVLDALEHAHENAVIHRDVKPENIFLHRNANGTTLTKLLDFGIMRLLDRKVSHTQGKFIGTLRYAAPEQIMGEKVGPQTDLYSLGVVLYEMLCGRGPFDDAGDAYAIGAAHAQKPAPPVSAFAQVPPSVERLVMASLAKNPAERPRDAFTFASELRRLLRDEEAAPRTQTAVAVLSSVPETRAVGPAAGAPPPGAPGAPAPLPAAAPAAAAPADPFTGTEAVPSLAGAAAAAAPAAPAAPAARGAPPPTRREGPVGGPATEQAMAPPSFGDTLLDPRSRSGSAPPPAALPPAAATHISGVGPAIDRNAETRASAPLGQTQRLAMNGTLMEDGLGSDPGADPALVHAALSERAPLEVPPASGSPHHAAHLAGASGELVFPSHVAQAGFASGTGPLSGEASTRPPERGLVLPIVLASVVSALLVGGAVLLITKPWARPEASAPAATAERGPAELAPAEPPPAELAPAEPPPAAPPVEPKAAPMAAATATEAPTEAPAPAPTATERRTTSRPKAPAATAPKPTATAAPASPAPKAPAPKAPAVPDPESIVF
jgi:eukaryotic-like serine/threonine-protein kinase